MSNKLSEKQALVIWSLLITGEQPKISEIKPKMTIAQCKPLEEAGLIRLEGKRPTYIVLEDKAWDWAIGNFESKFPPRSQSIHILQALLTKLGHYIDTRQVSLAEVLTASEPTDIVDENTSKVINSADLNSLSTDDLSEKVRQAYFSIPDGNDGFRVRLHELREHLPGLSKQQTNEAFLAMQEQGEISLLAAEDLQELDADDESAAIDMGGGDKRYFAYMKR